MKNSIIAAILSLITLVVLSDFNFFESLIWMPNFLWILPLYLFFRISVYYFLLAFECKQKMPLKIAMIVLNLCFIGLLLKIGFQIFKINNGNILMGEFTAFQMTLKNIWFWVVFQSYLLLLLFSAFKILVTIDQK